MVVKIKVVGVDNKIKDGEVKVKVNGEIKVEWAINNKGDGEDKIRADGDKIRADGEVSIKVEINIKVKLKIKVGKNKIKMDGVSDL